MTFEGDARSLENTPARRSSVLLRRTFQGSTPHGHACAALPRQHFCPNEWLGPVSWEVTAGAQPVATSCGASGLCERTSGLSSQDLGRYPRPFFIRQARRSQHRQ
jgi:hypothetical protein